VDTVAIVVVQALISVRRLEIGGFVVCGAQATFLCVLHDCGVISSLGQSERSVVQLEVVVNFSVHQLTSLVVSDLKFK
jgi:hypothetical protein